MEEDSLVERSREGSFLGDDFPRYSRIFWLSLVTGLAEIVTLAVSHGNPDFYYIQTNETVYNNVTCTERLIGLWSKCSRPCNQSSPYKCSKLSPDGDEAFITTTQVLESVDLFAIVFAVVLSISARRKKKIRHLKTSILTFITSGILCIVGAYLFVLDMKNHIPEEKTSVTNSTSVTFLDQGPRSSFYLCIASFVMAMLTAFLNGKDCCILVNYCLD